MSATAWISELGSAGGLQDRAGAARPALATSRSCWPASPSQAGVMLSRAAWATDGAHGIGPRAGGRRPAPAAASTCRSIVDAHLFGQAAVAGLPTPTAHQPCRWCWPACWRCRTRSAAWPSSGPTAAQREAVCSRQRRAGRRPAACGVPRPRAAGSRRRARGLSACRKSAVSARAAADQPRRAAPAAPAQRLQALAQNNGALLGGLLRAQAVFAAGQAAGLPHLSGRAQQSGGLHAARPARRRPDHGSQRHAAGRSQPRHGDPADALSARSAASVTVMRNGQRSRT